MENFKITKPLGDGTYGQVFQANNLKTGEIVAIKKFKRKYSSWDDVIHLREIKSLRKLSHQNIIKMKEVILHQEELYLVFEFLGRNLLEVYMDYKNKGEKIPETIIKSIVRQVLEGLAYMHKHGYFHRDLKPENLLMHGETVKICDFGLAREIRSRPPYTDYISTRWYRAPEILLKQNNYNSPVDIFALGCIMAELYMLAPLIDGKSEIDQIIKMCNVLGTPTHQQWPDVQKLASKAGISLPECQAQDLEKRIPNTQAVQVILEMLRYDPQKRMTAAQLLTLPYFNQFQPSIQFRNSAEVIEPRRSNQFRRQRDEFKDSSSNFLENLEKKLNEDDQKRKESTKEKFLKESGTRERFLKESGTREKFLNKDTREKFLMEKEREKEKDTLDTEVGNKRNNPFKLLKYNDPIMNSLQNQNNNYPHQLEVIRQPKKLTKSPPNPYSNSAPFSLPHILNRQDQVQYALPGINMTRQPSINQVGKYGNPTRMYGKLAEGMLGQRKVDEFGFQRQAPSKYGNY